jgi:hypothetical protein
MMFNALLIGTTLLIVIVPNLLALLFGRWKDSK